MKPVEHLHAGLDYLHSGSAELASAHFLAALTIRSILGDDTVTSASDETAIIPMSQPEIEVWMVQTANGEHTVWVNDSGDMQWLPVGHFGQPSWRQLFVEKRPRT